MVPSAMLAALLVLALGGGLSQVGVLGQIFAGPSLPALAPLGVTHAGPARAAQLLPVIPAARVLVASRPTTAVHRAPVPRSVVRVGGGASSGGAISPTGGGTVRPVTQGAAGGSSGAPPSSSAPQPSQPSQPQPSRPAPRPTPVDNVVKVVTSVTQQLPAPAGPVATETLQTAGAAADNVLGSTGVSVP